jgi:hypothetical protein
MAISILSLLILSACANQQHSITQAPTVSTPPAGKTKIKLTSKAFKEGESIPRQYTCDGINISPPLEWSGVPKTAKTIAVIVEDPDAPGGTWVHWVLYDLPADNIGIVENLPATEKLVAGGFQGTNDFGKIGYGGPCPPSGTHRYFFKIFAVDSELSLPAGATKDKVLKAMEGHVLADGQLMGTYVR